MIGPRSNPRSPLVALLAVALAGPASAQSIFTSAGGGFDDGKQATQSSLLGPQGVGVDLSGNIYVADGDHRVRRIDASSKVMTTAAGTGTSGLSGDGGRATSAMLWDPFGVAADFVGNVFVVDRGNHRIRQLDMGAGVIWTYAGTSQGFSGDNGRASAAQFDSPSGVAFDRYGILFVADAGNNRIRAINTATGIVTTYAGTGSAGYSGDGGAATQAKLYGPTGVAIAPNDDLLIADYWNHRVRRVDRRTGIIRTVAGSGTQGFSGDGGQATAASFNRVTAVAADTAGNVFVSDYYNLRIRRVDAVTGVVTTVAGNGSYGFSGDGIAATAASMAYVEALAVDRDGTLLYADRQAHRLRRVDLKTGLVTTVAGGGSVGDGSLAWTVRLHGMWGVAQDASGNVFISDTYNDKIRKVSAGGVLSTVAGTGTTRYGGDGGAATAAGLAFPTGLVLDRNGNLLIADSLNGRVRRYNPVSGIITTLAGGGSPASGNGDYGPATQASLWFPTDVAVFPNGDVLIAESSANRIRRVSASGGTITTFAGTGVYGYGGDGGPATAAQLRNPTGVAVDADGWAYIADADNHIVRLVKPDGSIWTTAGTAEQPGDDGDFGVAYHANLRRPRTVRIDGSGNVYIADWGNNRVRMIDAFTWTLYPLAGTGVQGYAGDYGMAWDAELDVPLCLATNSSGDVVIGDTGNGRLRSVLACRDTLSAPSLVTPADGATVGTTSTPIEWSSVPYAFRYDFKLGSTTSDLAVIGEDLTWTRGELSGLSAGRTYTWQVVAKGDPWCFTQALASSGTRSFRTAAGCTSPASAVLSAPADGAVDVSASPTLSWQAVAGAGTYDVYLGTSVPPALYRSGLTTTSIAVTGLAGGATYSWSVVARASCDSTKVSSSPTRTFRVAGGCKTPGTFALSAPAAGATVSPSTTLSWAASSNAATYDVYLGTTAAPPLYRSGVTQTSTTVSDLSPGTTYRWKVVARTSCDPSLTATSELRTFAITSTCQVPGTPTILFVPPTPVGKGQTYSIYWSDAANLDPLGSYVVERSTSSSFSPILDTQKVGSPSATFVAGTLGTIYHRVRAVPSCDTSKAGANSPAQSVTVIAASPNVVFTVQPRGVVTPLGTPLEAVNDVTFTLENVTDAPITVSIGRSEIKSSPFFQVVDPLGGDPALTVLESKKPRTFKVLFSGPPTNKADTFQGMVSVAAQGLAVLPYAYVSLKIGGDDTATPQFVVAGAEAEWAAFSPWKDGDPDASRPPLQVQIKNPGTTPMALTGEVGPELWLVPDASWNRDPIPAGGTVNVVLRTNRLYAPKGSKLPRYTYFKVRTKSGQTARLLVQDSDSTSKANGRAADPDPRGRGSLLLPSVVSGRNGAGQVTFVSRLRLSNASTAPLQIGLSFTPSGSDGFDTDTVKTVSLVVPANDVLSLTDPLVTVMGLTPTVYGTLEIRADPSQVGFLTVSSSVDSPASSGGGSYGFQMPVVKRGEGAYAGSPHVLTGLVSSAAFRTNLIMAETTGVDSASVRVVLYDPNGAARGNELVQVSRFGQAQLNGVVDRLGGGGLDGARLELTVESGGGSVVGVVTVIDNVNNDAVAYVSRPMNPAGSSALQKMTRAALDLEPTATTSRLLVPGVVNGYAAFPDGSQPGTFQSQLTFSSSNTQAATFTLEYVDETSGQHVTKQVNVDARATKVYKNVLEELFGYPAGSKTFGTVWVDASLNGIVQSKVYSQLAAGTLGDAFPVVAIPSEEMTGSGLSKPIMVDGLEQAVELVSGVWSDKARGTRTNLILNEVSGQPVTIRVSLYEASNRTSPLATRDYTLGAKERVQLSTVFNDLALNGDDRRKDRTNVLCSVQHVDGNGLVAGVITTVDNKTADIKTSKLSPSGGVPATGGVGIGR